MEAAIMFTQQEAEGKYGKGTVTFNLVCNAANGLPLLFV
jgi:hypothetical protein